MLYVNVSFLVDGPTGVGVKVNNNYGNTNNWFSLATTYTTNGAAISGNTNYLYVYSDNSVYYALTSSFQSGLTLSTYTTAQTFSYIACSYTGQIVVAGTKTAGKLYMLRFK